MLKKFFVPRSAAFYHVLCSICLFHAYSEPFMLSFLKKKVSVSTIDNLIMVLFFHMYLYKFNGKFSIEREMHAEFR